MRRVLLALSMGLLALGIGRVRRSAFDQHQRAQRYEDIYYLPGASWLPVLSAGYRDALADLLWCRWLVYFGEELGQRGPVRYVFEYADAVLALDPDFRAAYRWIATAAIYRPTALSVDNGLRAAAYLERALARWPDDGELHWDYGSLLRFELAPLERDARRKQQLIERAAPHLEAAARRGAGPPWLAINSGELLSKLGRTEQAIRHLSEVYGTVQDPDVRKEIGERLAALRSRAFAEGMRAAHEQFEAERQATYPYLSPSLFLLVGAPPGADAYERAVARSFFDDQGLAERADEPEAHDGEPAP